MCSVSPGRIGTRAWPGAEGETAPETLKQKDRDGLETLESRARLRAPSPKEQGGPASLNLSGAKDSGGAEGGPRRFVTTLLGCR